MRKSLAVLVIATGVASIPVVAAAQERLPEAGMGAAAGALVGGPVGAIAGGIVGYSAGPNIRRGLGIPKYPHHRRYSYRGDRRY